MAFTPTIEQQRVLDWISKGIGNAVIDAKAGSGKSTLIEHCIRKILERNPEEKIIYFAFNKGIVESMRDRFGEGYKNLKITTCHSFGLSVINENSEIKNNEPNDYKYISEFEMNFSFYSDERYSILDENSKVSYVSNIKKLLDYARYNKCQSSFEIMEIAEKYNLSVIMNECDVVSNLLRWGSENTDTFDFTDLIWLPCENGLNTRRTYNYVFVDEAQDLSPIEQELVKKCVDKRRGRMVIVGDKDQAINAWAGGDKDAFENFKKMRNTKSFTLSVCHRCSKSVIREAQKLVPGITARDDAEEGSVNYHVSHMLPKDGDLVLCRFTKPLVEYYNYMLMSGIKTHIVGKEIFERLIEEIELCDSDDVDKNLKNCGVIPTLYKKLFDRIEREMGENYAAIEDVLKKSKNIIEYYDIVKTIETLSSTEMTKSELINKIKEMYYNNSDEGITLSTIHKAKGGEADNVYILCPSALHSVLINSDWEKAQEDNLEYVMITRARKTLNYMSEYVFSMKELANFSKMKEELLEIKKILDENCH